MGSKKELKKSLSDLRGELTQTEEKLAKARTKAARWKQEAKAQRKTAAHAEARVDKLRKKLDRAPAAAAPMGDVAEPGEALVVPDESWTVVQLREEARIRGLTGMSNKPKDQLLAALS